MTRGHHLLPLALLWALATSAGPGGNAMAGPNDSRFFEASRIPAGLAKDADIVVREEVEVFEILDAERAVDKVRRVITVLNPRGRDAGSIVLPYDEFHTIRSLEGWILDAEGREIRRLRKPDIDDYSAIQGFSLYEDNRVKYAELHHDGYPYTVVFEYEVAYKGILGWPSWWPLSDAGPVEKSLFEIRAPADLPVRYQAVGCDLKPRLVEDGNRRIYQWSVSDQPRITIEPLGPSFREQAPHVLTGPARFEIAGEPGDMSSWESFGAWFHHLWEGRSTLPEPDAIQVRQICAGASSDRDKARRLYEHLQSKTRYVSVQLGIGGWQPFDAGYVSRLGYGDCKALTNYMKAMLAAEGIEAWPAFVMAGRNQADVVSGFPSNQFNHVILMVPFPGDTVWLECTSQSAPFAELGTFTEDRNTLVATAAGGRLVRTPVTASSDNRLVRKAQVVLGANGQAAADLVTLYTGNQQGDVRGRLARATPRERDEWLQQEIDLPILTVRKSDFSQLDRKTTDLELTATIEVPALGSRSGPRLFLRPNLANRWTLRLPRAADRKHPVRLPYAYVEEDTIRFELPSAHTVESAPPDIRLDKPFGTFESSVVIGPTSVEYRRRLEMKHKSIDVNAYEEFRLFLDEIVKADQAQLVLVRKS